MQIRGNKVLIRDVSRADISLLVKWKNDSEIADLVRGGPINTNIETETRRYEKYCQEYNMLRLIIETVTGKPIGFISITDIDRDNHKAVVGMLIGEKEYWGKGYGTDSLITLLKFLFFNKGFNRIGLEVFEYNLNAKKVYEKIGFKIEGIQRQGLFRNNEYYDILMMGILKEDFIRMLGDRDTIKESV